MTTLIDAVARAVARSRGQAVPIRSTSLMAIDDGDVFAIAVIRMVAEEHLQAIAFGNPHRKPAIITRTNPLGRDASELESFAAALNEYIQRRRATGNIPRFWVSHPAALAGIEILSHRYRTNKEATDTLRSMGTQCRIIADEARRPGQQTVFIATLLLTAHVATGQMPIEDGHLDALLAWLEPGVTDRAAEANRRSMLPAAAMLPRPDDDRVEELRLVAKESTRAGMRAKDEIVRLLELGARREWEMLIRARREFSRLGLQNSAEIDALVAITLDRTTFAFGNLVSPPSRSAALSKLLDDMEYESDVVAKFDAKNDALLRERLRRSGKAIQARVQAVDQPTRNRKPCTVSISTTQPVLRIRRDTLLQTTDGRVIGRVMSISSSSEGQRLELLLEKGVRAAVVPTVGDNVEWVEASPPDLRVLKQRVRAAAKEAGAFTITGATLPAAAPRAVRSKDLVKEVDRRRRF